MLLPLSFNDTRLIKHAFLPFQTSTSNSNPPQTPRNGTATPMMSPTGDSNKSSIANNGASNKKRISENACDGYFKKAKLGDETGGQVNCVSFLSLVSVTLKKKLKLFFILQGDESPNQSIVHGGEDSNSTSFSLDESSNTYVNIGEAHKNTESSGSQLVGASNSAALTKEVCHAIAITTERLCLNQCV